MNQILPLVSAIVPVYNGEAYLAQALDSILAQNYRPVEIIVVDDGSTDRSAAIARSYAAARYIYQENQGDAAARNTGILAAQGEFLAFLDADDLWLPDKISQQVNYLVEHPEAGAVICQMEVFLEEGMEWPASLNKGYYTQAPPAHLPSALLIRRTPQTEPICFFDSRYFYCNDSDWFFRAEDAGVLVTVVPRVLLRRRIHSQNRTQKVAAMNAELLHQVRASVLRKRAQQSGLKP